MAGYKIRDLEILTGIKAHTIRMWEKRYGLLTPQRTTTHIRTYSDDELLLLLNISLLNKKGIKISRIAEMSTRQIFDTSRSIHDSRDVDTAIEEFIVSVLQLDEHLFNKTFRELNQKAPLSDIFSEHIIPFLNRIGIMWMVGTINPAQEHFISNLIRQKIIAAIDQLPIPDPNAEKIIIYLPEHEWHEISLLVYHYHLRSKGINSIYLGQALPYDALIKTVETLKPKGIASSWLTAIEPQKILDYFIQLERDLGHLKIIAGGYQIDQLGSALSKNIRRIHTLSDLEQLIR
ncbi:MerR family transcriptional regulator [Fluviicola sp.]|uniref:MerR family transcriptional regulator n=1 Tax=Fluviicola sp. TaxID=1917219 RepID=UPI0031DFAF0F